MGKGSKAPSGATKKKASQGASKGGSNGKPQPSSKPKKQHVEAPKTRDRKGGHKLEHQPYSRQEFVQGLANQFTFIEWERDGCWRVSVPTGQRFSKQFLAGVEVWATQMMESGQVELMRSIQLSPPAAESQHRRHVPPPPPPTQPAAPSSQRVPGGSSVPPPVLASSNGSFTASTAASAATATPGGFSMMQLLDALPSMPSPQSSLSSQAKKAEGESHVADLEGSFCRPEIVGRDEQDAEGVGALEYSYTDISPADLRGDGAPVPGAGELSSGLSDEDEDLDDDSESDDDEDDDEEEGEEEDDSEVEDEEVDLGPVTGEFDDGDDRDISGEESEGSICESSSDDDANIPDGMLRACLEAADGDDSEDEIMGRSPPAALIPPNPCMKAPAASFGGLSLPRPPLLGTSPSRPPISPKIKHEFSKAVHSHRGERLKISLHLERQSMTDVEMCLLVKWYNERASRLVEMTKLWLFDNRLGDTGANACAELLHSGMKEVHLSHNFITTEGAKALLERCPTSREHGIKPLWLRMEWNLISPDTLIGSVLKQQRQKRGLVVDVPKVIKAGQGHGHEMNLKLGRTPLTGVHVQLPWLTCQKQPPSVSALLKDTQSAYSNPSAKPPAKAETSTSIARSLPATNSKAANEVSKKKAPVPPPSPPMPASYRGDLVHADGRDGGFLKGPLLIFPDTSALLSMLGANSDLSRPPIMMETLQRLALEGRFGRGGLAAEDRTFIVISDSVMKQLDGLKAVPGARVAIRKFLSEGLESMGPAGTDFLTVLGAHEGEGQLLESGSLGVAGSNSPHIGSKGQKVDYKIVEVAMYFQKEVLKSAGTSTAGLDEEGGGAKPLLPVMLLSNDNAQITIARAHGLPAFRLSSPEGVEHQMKEFLPGVKGPALSAGALRAMLAPQATRGLGNVAGQSLQHQFDEAISTMRALTSTLRLALGTMQSAAEAASSSQCQDDPSKAMNAVKQVREALLLSEASGEGTTSYESTSATTTSPLMASFSEMVEAVEGQLVEWEGLVKSHQAPSRVVQWAAAP